MCLLHWTKFIPTSSYPTFLLFPHSNVARREMYRPPRRGERSGVSAARKRIKEELPPFPRKQFSLAREEREKGAAPKWH